MLPAVKYLFLMTLVVFYWITTNLLKLEKTKWKHKKCMMTMEKSDFNRFDCLPNNYDCVFECSMNNNTGWTPSKTGGSKYLV